MQRNIKIVITFFIITFLLLSYWNYSEENKAPAPGGNSGNVNGNKKEGWEKIDPPEITYTNASTDMIVVELPFPGAVVGKEFSVIGKARGNWFFEASFPLRVLDKDGKVLVEHYAMAQGDPATGEVNWMTIEFVRFKGDLKVPESYIGPATLILMKDNPSGLPEHDASISFPIVIEY